MLQKIIFFLQPQQTALPGTFSQMVVMKGFAAVTVMDSTGVKDAVLTKAENVSPIRLSVKKFKWFK